MLRGCGGLARPGSMIAPMAAPAAQPASGPQPAQGIKRYIMCQRMFVVGQDFDLNHASGQPVYKIMRKVRVKKKSLKFYAGQGNLLYKLDEKNLRLRESFDILMPDSSLAAKLHNAIINPLREKFTIEIPGGENIITMGMVIWAQEDILHSSKQIAKISKQFSWIDSDHNLDRQG